MMNKKMEKAINDQINAEIYSSYLYLAMAAWFEGQGLMGYGNWLKVQALEELYHAMKFHGYLVDRGGAPVMAAIAKPPSSWASPLAAFQEVAKHEAKVTGLINNLVNTASTLKDHATSNFLQWYVSEQVEEESNAADAVAKLKLVGKDGQGMLMLDQQMAARVMNVPPDVKVVINPAAGGGAA